MNRLASAMAALFLVTGCAGFSADGGFGAVEQLTRERIGQSPAWQRSASQGDAARARVAELLAAPLTAEHAVELALLNNRNLQARYQSLGIAESELVRAGRLRNPSFAFGRLSGGGIVEIERALVFDILGLLAMPVAKEIESARFEQAQLQAAYDTIGTAAQTRHAYFRAVAAGELATYAAKVKDAADASSELADRMAAAGNFSSLARMREQSFYADATASLARARQQATAAREGLSRLLGLADAQLAFELPPRLPDLPLQPAEPKNAERTAMSRRLDVLLARRTTESLARSLGLTRATRMVNLLEAGYANASETGEPRKDGYAIELELPIFDFGSTRLAHAEAVYTQALHRAAAIAVTARSEVRETYSAYRTAHDLAKHYRDEVVPLSRRISEENLLRYNAMLIGVFDLLADSRAQIAAVTAGIEALRDYWMAETDLQTALTGRSPGGLASTPLLSATSARSGGNGH